MLLHRLRYVITLLKLQGLMFHSEPMKLSPNESDGKTTRWLSKCSPLVLLHFLYNLLVISVKTCGFVLTLRAFFSMSDSIAVSLINNVLVTTNSTLTINMYQSRFNFFTLLFTIVTLIIYLEAILMPPVFWLMTSRRNGFDKSVRQFAIIESTIDSFYADFNSKSERKLDRPKSKFHTFFLTGYALFSLPFVIGGVAYNIWSFILKNLTYNLPQLLKIEDFIMAAAFSLAFVDYFTTLYFVIAQILLHCSQVDAFNFYLEELITRKIAGEAEEFDIEIARGFYGELHETTNVMNSWMSLYFSLIYCSALPLICIYLYVLILLDVNLGALAGSLLVLGVTCLELSCCTLIALVLNIKASSIKSQLYKLNMQEMSKDEMNKVSPYASVSSNTLKLFSILF